MHTLFLQQNKINKFTRDRSRPLLILPSWNRITSYTNNTPVIAIQSTTILIVSCQHHLHRLRRRMHRLLKDRASPSCYICMRQQTVCSIAFGVQTHWLTHNIVWCNYHAKSGFSLRKCALAKYNELKKTFYYTQPNRFIYFHEKYIFCQQQNDVLLFTLNLIMRYILLKDQCCVTNSRIFVCDEQHSYVNTIDRAIAMIQKINFEQRVLKCMLTTIWIFTFINNCDDCDSLGAEFTSHTSRQNNTWKRVRL